MQRMGMVIGIAPARIAEYERLHVDVWPTVLERIRLSNIRNYSIFLREPENLLYTPIPLRPIISEANGSPREALR